MKEFVNRTVLVLLIMGMNFRSIDNSLGRKNGSKVEKPPLHMSIAPTAVVSKETITVAPTEVVQVQPSDHSLTPSPTPPVEAVLLNTTTPVVVTGIPLTISPTIPPTIPLFTSTIPPTRQPTPMTSYPTPYQPGRPISLPVDKFAALDILYTYSDISEQQNRLNTWLESFYQRHSSLSSSKRLIIYKVDPYAGLGNMFRGYFSTMAIAVLTNRFVQVQSFCDYVNLFFVPPFPHLSFKGNSTHNNQPSFIVKSNKYKVWKYSQTEQERNTVLNIPFSTFLRGSSIVFSTYSDITMSSLSPAMYAASLRQVGLLPTVIVPLREDLLGWSLRSIWLRLLFNPNRSLCSIITNHLKILHTRYLIGMQIRLGGKKANYVEKEMLGIKGMLSAVRIVKEHLKKTGRTGKDVYIFVSTDSDYAVKYISHQFEDCHCVYTVKDYEIGHSAAAASQGGNRKWKHATKRAIIDLMILKDSDFLVYTQKSSYGKFARELQLAKTSPIHVEPFLREHGLQCSVFQYNQTSTDAMKV